MVKKIKTKNEEVYFYTYYLNIIRNIVGEKKQDLIIKYSAIEVIEHIKTSNLGFIISGFICFISGLLIALKKSNFYILFIAFIFLIIFLVIYFIYLNEKIIIKTSSHKEEIKYDNKIYDELLKKIEK